MNVYILTYKIKCEKRKKKKKKVKQKIWEESKPFFFGHMCELDC